MLAKSRTSTNSHPSLRTIFSISRNLICIVSSLQVYNNTYLPTGNLDQATSQEILGLLLKYSSEYKQTLVIVTHDKEVAGQCGRIIEIADGRILKGI